MLATFQISFLFPCFSPSRYLEIERMFMLLRGTRGKSGLMSISHPWVFTHFGCIVVVLVPYWCCLAFWDIRVIHLNGVHGCGHLIPFTITHCGLFVLAPGLWYIACLLSSCFLSGTHSHFWITFMLYTGWKSKGTDSSSHTQHNISVSSKLCFAACWT